MATLVGTTVTTVLNTLPAEVAALIATLTGMVGSPPPQLFMQMLAVCAVQFNTLPKLPTSEPPTTGKKSINLHFEMCL